MPLVIQELVITTTVSDPATSANGVAQSGGSASGLPTDADARQALLTECVEEVMRILREKAER